MSSASSEQIWIFIYESASGSVNDYSIGSATFADIKTKGLTLADCLKISKVKGSSKPADYSFHIYCKSMAAAVRLLSDKSIRVTYELYCEHDEIVQIIIRDAKDPSPNTSRCPSHANSSKAKAKLTRGKLVPELFIAPQQGHVKGSSDAMTGDELTDTADMVTIALGHGEKVTVSKDYLLGWDKSQLADCKGLTDIEVDAITDGVTRTVKLNDRVWQQSLIRGSWAKEFSAIWSKYNEADVERKRILAECISRVPGFSNSCGNFIFDLRGYGTDKKASTRLDSTAHEFFLGNPYFDSPTVAKILSIPTVNGTVEGDLRMLARKRGNDGTVCASHDLAPLFGSVLLVRWDKENKKAVAMHGDLPVSAPAVAGPSDVKGKKKFFDTFKSRGNKKDRGGQGGKV